MRDRPVFGTLWGEAGTVRGLVAGAFLAAAVMVVAAPLGGDAEVGLLAFLTAALVAVLAAVAPRPGWEAAGLALFAAMLLWVLPPQGATRAVAVGLLWVAAFVAVAARRFYGKLEGSREEPSEGASGRSSTDLALGPELWVGLAFAAQWLMRAETLIEPLSSPRTLVVLLGMPLAAGLAAWWLARAHGARPALLAAMLVLLTGPGLRVAGTLTLVAMAVAGFVFDRRRSWWSRGGVLAVILAPIAWEPRTGALIALVAFALAATLAAPARPGSAEPAETGTKTETGAPTGTAAMAAVVLAAAILFVPFAARSWIEALRVAAWLPLLLPAVALPARGLRGRWATALLLTLVAAHGLPAEALAAGGLAAPLALAALAVRRRGWAIQAQTAWSALLLAATAVLAGYPWLRPTPLADAVDLFQLGPTGEFGVAALILALPLFLVGFFEPSANPASGLAARPGSRRWGWLVVLILLGLVLAPLRRLPRPGKALPLTSAVVFDSKRPSQLLEIEEPFFGLAIESRLVNAPTLAAGTPVATVRVSDGQGAVHEHTLEAGRDTGEWAARRPDVALLPELAAPPPWRCRLAPEGTFFAQSYRSRWSFRDEASGSRVAATRLEVTLDPDLPPEVALVVSRLELLP